MLNSLHKIEILYAYDSLTRSKTGSELIFCRYLFIKSHEKLYKLTELSRYCGEVNIKKYKIEKVDEITFERTKDCETDYSLICTEKSSSLKEYNNKNDLPIVFKDVIDKHDNIGNILYNDLLLIGFNESNDLAFYYINDNYFNVYDPNIFLNELDNNKTKDNEYDR